MMNLIIQGQKKEYDDNSSIKDILTAEKVETPEYVTVSVNDELYDAKESEWEILEDNYKSIIPEEYRWRNWAPDNKDGKAITGEEMSNFIIQLFVALKDLNVDKFISPDF